MLNPKYARYADRLQQMIFEGAKLIATRQNDTYIADHVGLHAWLVKTENILSLVFGPSSMQVTTFQELSRTGSLYVWGVGKILGHLTGCLDDLRNGFLTRQEFFIAGAVFDDVLQEAKHLNDAAHKDAAAMLMRVALEDSLKRLARDEGIIPDGMKASVINDQLKDKRYPQNQWRLNQACLDVGNDAAHGQFEKYTQVDVKARIEDVERFLACYFSA